MSTALYIMGYEKACQFWRQHREEFNVILVTDDGKIHISENLKENFQTECDLEMIESESEKKNIYLEDAEIIAAIKELLTAGELFLQKSVMKGMKNKKLK